MKGLIEANKGFYPDGCTINGTDNYVGPTYVLSAEAYRALMLN